MENYCRTCGSKYQWRYAHDAGYDSTNGRKQHLEVLVCPTAEKENWLKRLTSCHEIFGIERRTVYTKRSSNG